MHIMAISDSALFLVNVAYVYSDCGVVPELL